MIGNVIQPNGAVSGALSYVDSSTIPLNALSWSVTQSGMSYANASAYVNVPSNAKIVSAILIDWGNLPADLVVQAYVDSYYKLCLMCNQNTWPESAPRLIYRVFYTV